MDWQHQSLKLDSLGLDLTHSLDQIPEHAYCFFSNATTVFEGTLTTRPGLIDFFHVVSGVHTLAMTFMPITAPLQADMPVLIVGAADRLARRWDDGWGWTPGLGTEHIEYFDLANEDNFTGWSYGGPISYVSWRPGWDNQSWLYLCSSTQYANPFNPPSVSGFGMRKVNASGQCYGIGIDSPYELWGEPDIQAHGSQGTQVMGVDLKSYDVSAFSGGSPKNCGISVSNSGGLLDSNAGIKYDWRYTYFNSKQGIESNPNAEGEQFDATTTGSAVLTMINSPDAQVDQIRIYRRGGTLFDWYLVDTIDQAGPGDPGYFGFTCTDGIGRYGTQYTDIKADSAIAGGYILSLENDKPFTSYNASTAKVVYGQPVRSLFGPFLGKYMFGVGDPYRPSHLYWTNPWAPDNASAANNLEITSPDEPLVTGFIYDGKAFVITHRTIYAIYPTIVGETSSFVALPTPAGNGIWAPYSICVGPKVWFLGKTGIFEFTGGPAQNITEDSLVRPIFYVAPSATNPVYGHPSIDWSASPDSFRLEYQEPYLYFHYQGINTSNETAYQTMRYHTIFKRWEPWSVDLGIDFIKMSYWDQENRRMYFGSNDGTVFYQGGYTDGATTEAGTDGQQIETLISTAFLDQGLGRVNKVYGDAYIEYNSHGVTDITVTPYINEDIYTPLQSQVLPSSTTRVRAIIPLRAIDGTEGILARSICFSFKWHSTDIPPEIHEINIAHLPRTDEFTVRETDWDDAGHPAPKWVRGVILDIDAYSTAKTFYVQGDAVTHGPYTIGALAGTVNQSNRRVLSFSWPVFRATNLRIVNTDTDSWMVYKITWLFTKEPEEIARWDGQGWEDLGWPYEKYIKGVSVECDTEGAAKTLELRIDGDDATAVDTITANTVGRSIVMHKFNNVLARTVKLVAMDDNPGYLYGIKWIWDEEPPRITRWETQEHTFQSKGYTYLREILVGVRSWDTICLDIWADMGDGSFNYQLPRKYIESTQGERRKPKVEVEAIKGKNWKFLFTSKESFKLYLGDSEVRLKEWNPDLGWKVYQLPFEGGIENP